MGLFSGKKIVVVDSVVYNLAGDEKDRPDYLKSLVVRNVLSGTKDSLGETISDGYLHGPAMKFRSFYRWAQKPENYGEIGMPTGAITNIASINPSDIPDVIPHEADETVWVQKVETGSGDAAYWAEQWILEYYPAEAETDWSWEYDANLGQILVRFVDNTSVYFTPSGFDLGSRYIYAYYNLNKTDAVGPLITGSTTVIGSDPFPSVTGWTLDSDTVIIKTVDINGTPTDYESGEKIYIQTSPVSVDNGTMYFTTSFMHFIYNAHVETTPGEPDPENPEVEPEPVESLVLDNAWRIDTQRTTVNNYSNIKLFIYRFGSGNAALDALAVDRGDYGQFFPFIPIRLDNEFLSETNHPEVFAQTKKAYKKATGSKLTKIIEDIADNESLDDIDNTYVVFGVSLNVVENACRRYIYTFLKKLQASQIGGPNVYADYKQAVLDQKPIADAWWEWFWTRDGHEHVGEEPPKPVYPTLPDNELRIKGQSNLDTQYDVRIQWKFITEVNGTGLGKAGAKPGDVWLEFTGTDDVTVTILSTKFENTMDRSDKYEKIRVWQQVTANTYTYLDVVGLIQRNYVYKMDSQIISAKKALEDVDESGFIIPLHYQTWTDTPLINSTQMATACVFVVFNCYEIHKQKWYQTGIFKILFVIVLAIVSVIFTGGAGIGILGANMTIGTAFGFSGLTAAIVGSVANALAALVISTILEKVVADLGILGQIIGALIGFVVGSISSISTGGLASFNWGDLLRADRILALTNSVGKGIAGAINADTMGYAQKMQDLQERADEELKKINEAYYSEFGYGGQGLINPFTFVDADTSLKAESSSTFLARTLMTGSDVAQMSQDLLYDFVKYSLKLPDAFT